LKINKKYILFDLDGTLTDPKEGITRSVQYSLRHFGIEENDLDGLTRFIGPPLRESFGRLGLSSGDFETAVAKYREYYSERGIYENALYDRIDELLHGLRDRGRTLAVATSKATVYAVRVLEHFDILKYFSFVAGSELDGRRSDKGEVIHYALEELKVTGFENAVMVGDREHDIIGAKNAGIMSVGVLYGYGGRAELEEAGADYIVRDIGELAGLLA